MRRRFFVDEVRNGHAEIAGDEAKHLTRVLRVEAGQRYEISDNRSVYLAEIETARKEHVIFRTLEKLPAGEPQVRLILCAALIKFDRFEWLIEKATELGVSRLIPVNAERTENGLAAAAAKRMERWRKIAHESSQQSRRLRLPEIAPAEPFTAAITDASPLRVFLDEQPGAPPLSQASPPQGPIAVLTGPEGGWTDRERTAALSAGWKPVSLGPSILRAETAAIAALAVIGQAKYIAY